MKRVIIPLIILGCLGIAGEDAAAGVSWGNSLSGALVHAKRCGKDLILVFSSPR